MSCSLASLPSTSASSSPVLMGDPSLRESSSTSATTEPSSSSSSSLRRRLGTMFLWRMDGMVESHGGVCRERKMQVAGQGLEEIWEATRGRMPATRDINRIKVGEVVLKVCYMA